MDKSTVTCITAESVLYWKMVYESLYLLTTETIYILGDKIRTPWCITYFLFYTQTNMKWDFKQTMPN